MARTTNYGQNSRYICNIRSLVFLIGTIFLTTQFGFLALNIFLYIDDSEAYVGTFLDWFVDHGVRLRFCEGQILPSPVSKSPSSNQQSSDTPSAEAKDADLTNYIPSSAMSPNGIDNRSCIIRVSIKIETNYVRGTKIFFCVLLEKSIF